METLISFLMLIILLAFFAFMAIINSITKILNGGTGKIAATGFVGFLLVKFFGPKFEKYVKEYLDSKKQDDKKQDDKKQDDE